MKNQQILAKALRFVRFRVRFQLTFHGGEPPKLVDSPRRPRAARAVQGVAARPGAGGGDLAPKIDCSS